MDGTILSQGSFTQGAAAVNQIVAVPSGVDWIKTWNVTQISTPANGVGVEYYWQRGMAQPFAVETRYATGATTSVVIDAITASGFSLYDPTASAFGAPVATTASTNATRPVVSTASTAGLTAGVSIVRLTNTAQLDINGVDFVVDSIVPNTSFRLQNTLATAPGLIGGAGFYRIVNRNPLFYPRRRNIASITQAANANVLTTVPHGYVNGQLIRFSVGQASGMVQIDQMLGTVTVVDANNFTVNIDTTGFTAYTYPTSAQILAGAQFPIVVPVGENTAGALAMSPVPDILSDATVNTGFLGVIMPAGANAPGGQANDTVFWVAGKATYGGL